MGSGGPSGVLQALDPLGKITKILRIEYVRVVFILQLCIGNKQIYHTYMYNYST